MREGVFLEKTEIIELFCFVDDFNKALGKTKQGKEKLDEWRAKRGPQKSLSLSEVVILNVLYKESHVGDLKAFVKMARSMFGSYFPRMPSYANIAKAFNESVWFAEVFIQYLMMLNRQISKKKKYYIDSTPISVCKNWNISSHRVAKGYAAKGKTTRGWNYGFKLHGACDEERNIVGLKLTPGNVPDSKMAEDVTKGIKGTVIGDAGYILRQEVFRRMLKKHVHVLAAKRKNMRGIMTKDQEKLFKERNAIENVWGVLKERYGLVFHMARSITGLFRHYCYCILSYMLHKLFNPRPLKISVIT